VEEMGEMRNRYEDLLKIKKIKTCAEEASLYA
jgi:hypothetical protein